MSILGIPSSLFLTPINNLDLSRRTKNSLLNAGFLYLGDLNEKRKEDIKKQCKGMGIKCLSEIFDSSIIDDCVKRVEQENLIQTLIPSEQLQYCTDISGFVKNNYPSDYCDILWILIEAILWLIALLEMPFSISLNRLACTGGLTLCCLSRASFWIANTLGCSDEAGFTLTLPYYIESSMFLC